MYVLNIDIIHILHVQQYMYVDICLYRYINIVYINVIYLYKQCCINVIYLYKRCLYIINFWAFTNIILIKLENSYLFINMCIISEWVHMCMWAPVYVKNASVCILMFTPDEILQFYLISLDHLCIKHLPNEYITVENIKYH